MGGSYHGSGTLYNCCYKHGGSDSYDGYNSRHDGNTKLH